MFAAVAVQAIAIVAAGCVGALITYVCCCVHCEHAHHVETEVPRQRS